MTWLKMVRHWLLGVPDPQCSDLRQEVREAVHSYGNVASKAQAQAHIARKSSLESLRVAEDAIKSLERARDKRQENEARQ